MKLALLLIVSLAACSDAGESSPDAARSCSYVEALDRCGQYEEPMPPCYQNPCECGGERVCGTKDVCQHWEDGVFACRVQYWCECR